MSANDVVKYYNVFDIIAYPRKDNCLCQSTSSYKVFEAMSMARPIIVSELDAWKEIIQDNVTGLYCQPDNEQNLLQKFVKLMDDQDLRNELGNNAREWVIKNREWKNMGGELRDIYDRILNNVKDDGSLEPEETQHEEMCDGCKQREKDCDENQEDHETKVFDGNEEKEEKESNIKEIVKVDKPKKSVKFSEETKKESVDDKINRIQNQPILKSHENAEPPVDDTEDNNEDKEEIEVIDDIKVIEEDDGYDEDLILDEDSIREQQEDSQNKKWKKDYDKVVKSLDEKNEKKNVPNIVVTSS